MKKTLRSEIFELLSSFSKQEMKKFGEFLNSPFHNKSKKLVKVYSFIRKFHPGFCDDKLTLESIHNCWQPDAEFHVPTVRNDLSDLYKMGLTFLSTKSFLSLEQNVIHFKMNELLSRNHFTLFNRYLKQIEPVINGKDGWSIELFQIRTRVNSHIVNKELSLIEVSGDSKNRTKKIYDLYDETYNYLQSFLISIISEMYLNLNFSNIDTEVPITDLKIVEFINNPSYKFIKQVLEKDNDTSALAKLYILAIDMLNDFNNDDAYFDYKNYLIDNLKKLDYTAQSTHISILLSYCLRKRESRINKLKFSKEMLYLYDIVLLEELYKSADMKYLDPLNFRNMIVIAMEVNNYAWLDNLLKTHLAKLEKSHREVMKYYLLMHQAFEQNLFESSLEYSNKISASYQNFRIDVIVNKLKCYYELGYYESAINMIQSNINNIRKSEMFSSSVSRKHISFLSLVKKLIMIRLSNKEPDNKLIEFFKKEMQFLSLHGLRWYSKKLDELIKEKSIK